MPRLTVQKQGEKITRSQIQTCSHHRVVPVQISHYIPLLVNSLTPSRITAFGKNDVWNLGSTILVASELFSKSSIFTASLSSTSMNLHQPIDLPIRQKLESVPEILARTRWRGIRPKHCCLTGIRTVLNTQDSVRVPPVVLAAARRTPPVAPFCPCPVEANQM